LPIAILENLHSPLWTRFFLETPPLLEDFSKERDVLLLRKEQKIHFWGRKFEQKAALFGEAQVAE